MDRNAPQPAPPGLIASGERREETLTLTAPDATGRTQLGFELYRFDAVGPYRTAHDLLLTDEEVATPRPVGFLVNAFLALVNLPLIVATVVVERYLRYGRLQLGLTLGGLPWPLPVVASGAAIGYLERLIIQPAPLAHGLAFIVPFIVLPKLGG